MMPQAIVIDRPTASRTIKDLDECFTELGGAWLEMFELWRRLECSPYLILLAHTTERLRQRAPLTYFVIDDKALAETMRLVCRNLDAVQCRWALFVEKGSEADQIVRQELLADSIVEGRA